MSVRYDWYKVCFMLLLLAGCENSIKEKARFQIVSLPSTEHAVFPNLISHQENLLLSWIDESEEGLDKLLFSERSDENWSEPRMMAQGSNWFVNWADFPTMGINAAGDKFTHYLAKSAEGTYDYDVQLVRQGKGDLEWLEIGKPYRDTTKGEHGFVSMFQAPDNQFGVVWLDGRKYATGKEEMMLMGSFVDEKGNPGVEMILDERVCDCCQTDAVTTDDGIVVVYRNRSEDEIRDIYRVIYKDGQWSDPAPVSHDQWHISGCPVNGPAIDALGQKVAVGWFTNANDSARVNVIFSEDGGEHFHNQKQIDLGNPMGRIDLKIDESGNTWVSWMENVDQEAQIYLRKITPNGLVEAPMVVSEVNEHRASGFPRMAIFSGELFLVWTNSEKPSQLVMAKIKIN